MNRENLLNLYERLTKLVEKLPGGLQKPILRELVPIRELFLEQRPPRLMLVGTPECSAAEFLRRMGASPLDAGALDNGWRNYAVHGRGEVLVLDARSDIPQSAVETALGRKQPDVLIFLQDAQPTKAQNLELAAARTALCPADVPLVGISFAGDAGRARLAALLQSSRGFSQRKHAVACWRDDGKAEEAEAICGVLPNAAKLEFARLTGARAAQAAIASSLLKSFTAVCGVIGLQPIPLADMPVLTTLQSLMVGLIVYTTGRRVNMRLVTEFLGALGFNIGAGILFREGARALIKIIPFWGNAVSGLVAGAGTYAIGRAAISYFIEETPIQETRRLFNKLLPTLGTFKRRRTPILKARKKGQPPPLPEE